MNTNRLKTFAQETRVKLINLVETKLNYILESDTAQLRERQDQVDKLKRELESTTKEQLIEKVAYTWFNRFVALRFMDVNGYQPSDVRAITPKEGFTIPELLSDVKEGHYPDDITVNKEHITDLLLNKVPNSDPQNEVYKILLVATCNALNPIFPFLFEKIKDYTELLMPDDLISDKSILKDIRDNMSEEDCKDVEIIGWLYQFYISEKKDEVFASKGKVKKEDIPAATQLFTPRWIVEYMTQNSVGKLWLKSKPESDLQSKMKYYIPSESPNDEDSLKVKSPEELTVIDPACGSGHILVYAFELLTQIYEEEGYKEKEIPQLILTHNLTGIDIDERAAQLASFALMMKAREYSRRFFRNPIVPNIVSLIDYKLQDNELNEISRKLSITPSTELLRDLGLMRQATNIGSLITPQSNIKEQQNLLHKVKESKELQADLILSEPAKNLIDALKQLITLRTEYTSVIANPPYMGGGNMNPELSTYVKKHYKDSKADLMACFMERGLSLLPKEGYMSMINQHSWMFLSSYENLRVNLIHSIFFDTMLHLGTRTFPEIGGEVVQNTAFSFYKKELSRNGSYIRLTGFNNTILKAEKTIEASKEIDCDWIYKSNQNDFEKIPGSPIGYWATKNILNLFTKSKINEISNTRLGMATADNNKFLRFWFEVDDTKSGLKIQSREEAKSSGKKWFSYQKGGEYRKWYGNLEYLVNWQNDGHKIRNFTDKKTGKVRSHNYNLEYIFSEGVTWNALSSSKTSARLSTNSLFDNAGSSLFAIEPRLHRSILAYLNSGFLPSIIGIISSTLNYQPGDIGKLPAYFPNEIVPKLNSLVDSSINYSKSEWDSHETSWDFKKSELLTHKSSSNLSDAYDDYKNLWTNKFFQLHQNEEKLNNIFINIYNLQDELDPTVSLKDITILHQEFDQKSLEVMNSKVLRKTDSWEVENYDQLELPFEKKEVVTQFISYAVGNMFGRYSLDKEGLILANAGETLEDYLKLVPTPSFTPTETNVIPVLENDWFKDDIVEQFKSFLKASFGTENFEVNLKFIEDAIGKDIKKFFNKDFFKYHLKMYKKRPIYWMFSSPKGAFKALIYMHRYNSDTVSVILNKYLREYLEKIDGVKRDLQRIIDDTSSSAKDISTATKELDKLLKDEKEIKDYEDNVLFSMAQKRIEIDLDEGVLVNYNKLGKALEKVVGLNDPKTDKKVAGFDWVKR